jgi:predicted HicB family RNase H-like nuclease
MSDLKAKLKANLKPAPTARTADILRPSASPGDADSSTLTKTRPAPAEPGRTPTTRTTLELPADLHIQLRYTAIDTATSLNTMVAQAVIQYLDALDQHNHPAAAELDAAGGTPTRVVTVRIDTELHRRLRRTALAHNTTMSALVANALRSTSPNQQVQQDSSS